MVDEMFDDRISNGGYGHSSGLGDIMDAFFLPNSSSLELPSQFQGTSFGPQTSFQLHSGHGGQQHQLSAPFNSDLLQPLSMYHQPPTFNINIHNGMQTPSAAGGLVHASALPPAASVPNPTGPGMPAISGSLSWDTLNEINQIRETLKQQQHLQQQQQQQQQQQLQLQYTESSHNGVGAMPAIKIDVSQPAHKPLQPPSQQQQQRSARRKVAQAGSAAAEALREGPSSPPPPLMKQSLSTQLLQQQQQQQQQQRQQQAGGAPAGLSAGNLPGGSASALPIGTSAAANLSIYLQQQQEEQAAAAAAAAAAATAVPAWRQGSGSEKALKRGASASGSMDEDDSDGSQDGGGRGAGGRNGSRRASVSQEKNRTAQRRFRLRQKAKMTDLESKVDLLSVRLGKVSKENESLRNLNNMLEKVLNVRDDHLTTLQEAVNIFEPHKEPTPPPPSTQRPDSGTVLQLKQWPGTSRGGSGGLDSSSDDDDMTAVQNSRAAAVAEYAPDRVRSMTPAEVFSVWRDHCQRMTRQLTILEQGGPRGDRALQKVEALLQQVGPFCSRVAAFMPLNIKALLATNLETLEPAGVEEQHWNRVVSGLYLSSQQQQDALQGRERFLAQLHEILQHRRAAHALLADGQPRQLCHTDIMRASLQAHAALDKLKENLHKEHNLHMEFVVHLFKHVLSPIQVAKASAMSYPFFPDPLAITNVVARELEEAAAATAGAATL